MDSRPAISLLSALFALGVWTGCKGNAGGDELFDSACARCHGEQGEGGIETRGKKSRDLTDPKWQATVTDAELRQIIRNGRGEMPAFGTVLTIDRIDKIVKHIRSLKQPEAEPKAPEAEPKAKE